MTDPLVSVVIPTYFRNERLVAAIESALAQPVPVEVIVVDGSGDAHAAAVVPDDDRVRYVAQAADEGAHAARSEGADLARGEYVQFLDDDDRLHPEKFARQLPLFDDATGVVYCAVEWESGHVVHPDPRVQGDVLEYALMFQMTPSSPSAMLVRADVLRPLLPLGNRHGADDMGMKIDLAERTHFTFVDEPLVVKGDSGDASLGSSRANVTGRLAILADYAPLYAQFPPRVRRTALAHTYLLDADLTLDAELWSPRAVWNALRAVLTVPGWPLSFVGYLGASLFGRPGRDTGWKVYHRFVLGDEHVGKVT